MVTPYPDAGEFDSASPEWRDICMARHICRMPYLGVRDDALRKPRQQRFVRLVYEQWGCRGKWEPGWVARKGEVPTSLAMPAAPAPEMETVAHQGEGPRMLVKGQMNLV